MTVPLQENAGDLRGFDSVYADAQVGLLDDRRLAAVRATGLLDTEIEESFDRLTRLAVRLVKIPAAFVSLVDENRDFYKSACGFGEPLASSRELQGPTFCHFTIQATEPLVIPDTASHPVYQHVPTVRSLGVAAYVGIPIEINGEVVGAFCAIDVKPHPWTEDEVSVLTELAAVAVSEIHLRASRSEAERLRQEAEALASELDRARAQAEEANRAKSDFLAAMSHDLRTPLNAIGGYAQLIEMGINGPVNEQQHDSASRILRAQRHLLNLIDDILDFAKSERGETKLLMGSVAMEAVCEAVTSLMGQQAAAKKIEFACAIQGDQDGELIANGDFERVVQVLVNLSTNAIKFTDEGGRVAVTMRSNGTWIEAAVTDTGLGIAPENFERIFNPFVQLSGAAGIRGGVGLGLATSRDLARRMGGDILVESELGVGSTFIFRLKAK